MHQLTIKNKLDEFILIGMQSYIVMLNIFPCGWSTASFAPFLSSLIYLFPFSHCSYLFAFHFFSIFYPTFFKCFFFHFIYNIFFVVVRFIRSRQCMCVKSLVSFKNLSSNSANRKSFRIVYFCLFINASQFHFNFMYIVHI